MYVMQTFEKVFQTALSPSLVTIRIEYVKYNGKYKDQSSGFIFIVVPLLLIMIIT